MRPLRHCLSLVRDPWAPIHARSNSLRTIRVRAGRRMGRCWARACAVVLASLGVSVASALGDTVPGSIHTIFSTECNRYFDWCATPRERLTEAAWLPCDWVRCQVAHHTR